MSDAQPQIDKAVLLTQWVAAKKQLVEVAKPLVDAESVLRKQVIALYFPKPEEGTNTTDLANGWKLKATTPTDRKVEPDKLDQLKAAKVADSVDLLRAVGLTPELYAPDAPLLQAVGIAADIVVTWDPKLATKAYKGLTAEQRKLLDHAITAKPGSASLELVPPKEPKED